MVGARDFKSLVRRDLAKELDSLKDRVTIARINARLNRVEQGILGDAKPAGEGMMVLRFVFGSGYRGYFGMEWNGTKLVVLLTGGDKSTQDKDINLAHEYWSDYLRPKCQHIPES